MVCCFHVPVLPWTTEDFQSLVNLCNELYSTSRDEFEMVVVARMNALANDRRVFDHFFSGFPSSCLAVPFNDHHRRDHVCKVLDLGFDSCQFESLFLSPEGVVLPPVCGGIFMYYGAEAFPFSKDDLGKRAAVCRDIYHGKAKLDRVLKCNDDSPGFVYKFNPVGGPREMVSISQLTNKNVGVYLCSRGDMIPKLLEVYEQCRERQLEIEIVVVYLPFVTEIDPKIFQRKMDSLLKKHNVRGWYCLPFNNSVSRRFWKLAHVHYDDDLEDMLGHDTDYDKLIMVGPSVKKNLDIYGGDLINMYGVDAYPFTTVAAAQMPNQKQRFEFEKRLKEFRVEGKRLKEEKKATRH